MSFQIDSSMVGIANSVHLMTAIEPLVRKAGTGPQETVAFANWVPQSRHWHFECVCNFNVKFRARSLEIWLTGLDQVLPPMKLSP
jgi:hypothetical protein